MGITSRSARFLRQVVKRIEMTSARKPWSEVRSMRRIAVVVALLSSWPGLPVVGQAPSATNDVAPATVVRLPNASLAREQVATVLLPASYGSSRQRYPVVYLLHGGGQ